MKRKEAVLKNGMKVIAVQKPEFVQSFAMIGIPAGGNARLQKGKDGLYRHPAGVAHFLEHQMFYLDGEDVTAALSDVSAGSNAYTSEDRTCYYIWTNEDPLEAMEILAGFVQQLDITEQTIAKEKGIILSEYAMYDQQPDTRIYKEALMSLYHHHPIREDILGSMEEIKAMDEKDLHAFYDAFYDPSQLVYVVVSSKDPQEMIDAIEKMEEKFPSLQKGASIVYEQEPREVKRELFEDEMDLSLPYAMMAIKIDPARNEEEAYLLDLLINLYLESVFSPLNPEYQELLNGGIITQSLNTQASINTGYGHILISSQSRDPEALFEWIERKLSEKAPMDPALFQALKHREIAEVIRSEENFEILANDLIETAMDGVDYDLLNEQVFALDLKDLEAWLAKTDLDRISKVILYPKGQMPSKKQIL